MEQILCVAIFATKNKLLEFKGSVIHHSGNSERDSTIPQLHWTRRARADNCTDSTLIKEELHSGFVANLRSSIKFYCRRRVSVSWWWTRNVTHGSCGIRCFDTCRRCMCVALQEKTPITKAFRWHKPFGLFAFFPVLIYVESSIVRITGVYWQRNLDINARSTNCNMRTLKSSQSNENTL